MSGSKDGDIKIWRILSSRQVEAYGPSKDLSNCIATLDNAHETEPIWDLSLHSVENFLVSIGSDATIAMWKVPIDIHSL